LDSFGPRVKIALAPQVSFEALAPEV
jgi:hypothetical protein